MSLLFIRILCVIIILSAPANGEGWLNKFINRIFPQTPNAQQPTTKLPTQSNFDLLPGSPGCEVNIRNGTPSSKDPLYLDLATNLWVPGPKLLWYTNQATLAVCPGRANEITLNQKQEARMTCKFGTTFQIDDLQNNGQDFKQVQCKNNVSPDIKDTGRSCELGGTIFEIGFETTFGFKPIIVSCYDILLGNVRYTDHVVYGAAIANAAVEKNRPTFKSAGTAKHINPRTHYTREAQVVRFSRLLGSKSKAEQLITATSYLARGHLTPDGDGIYRTWQYATYFYINVVPMWQVINNGNWRIIENKVREYAADLKQNVYVRSGGIDVMTMENGHDGLVNVTLQAGGIEVPKWIYKLIRTDFQNGNGIIFYALNDPFTTTNDGRWCEGSVNLCSGTISKGSRSRWYHDDFKNYGKGLVVCCELKNIRQRPHGS